MRKRVEGGARKRSEVRGGGGAMTLLSKRNKNSPTTVSNVASSCTAVRVRVSTLRLSSLLWEVIAVRQTVQSTLASPCPLVESLALQNRHATHYIDCPIVRRTGDAQEGSSSHRPRQSRSRPWARPQETVLTVFSRGGQEPSQVRQQQVRDGRGGLTAAGSQLTGHPSLTHSLNE